MNTQRRWPAPWVFSLLILPLGMIFGFNFTAMYGNPIDSRHEPVNEQGVVFLFGMLAKELGYMVEALQKGFPDCEAKRQITPDRR